MSQLTQNALCGTAMILAVAVLRLLLRDRLVPGARLALWAACLFRLLTPWVPESVLSLWGLSRLFAAEKPAAAPPAVPQYVLIPNGTAMPAPAPQPQAISWETVLLAVWLLVGAVLAARYVLSWVRTRRAVSCAIPLDKDDPRYLPLPKCARLREGVMEGAPLTFGAIRPTVVLSPGLEGDELTCVLAHEGVHARRRDNLWHYVTAAALVLYWWDPAVWLMAKLIRRDVELSCDRAAVKALGADRRADYAKALVSLATQTEGPAFCQTFGRKAAEERILSIMKCKKLTFIGAIFTLALVLAVTVAFASDPAEQKAPDTASGVYHYAVDGTTLLWSFSVGRTMTQFTVDLDALDASLVQDVADGWFTQAQADDIRARAVAFRDRMPGTPFGGWLVAEDGSITDDPDSIIRPENSSRPVFEALDVKDGVADGILGSAIVEYDKLEVEERDGKFYYKDVDGSLVPIDPDTVVTDSYVFTGDGKGGVMGFTPEGHLLNNVHVEVANPGPPVDPDTVDLTRYKALLDEQVVAGELTQDAADAMLKGVEDLLDQARQGKAQVYMTDAGDDITWLSVSSEAAADGVSAGLINMIPSRLDPEPIPMTLDEYQAHLDGLVAAGKMAQKDADELLAWAKEDWAEYGKDSGARCVLMVTESGSYAVMPARQSTPGPVTRSIWPVCTEEGCELIGWHEHNGVNCYGEAHQTETHHSNHH